MANIPITTGSSGVSPSVVQQILDYANNFAGRDGHLLIPDFAQACVAGAPPGLFNQQDVLDVLVHAGWRAAPGDNSKWYGPNSVFWNNPNKLTQALYGPGQLVAPTFPSGQITPPPLVAPKKPPRRKFKDGDLVEALPNNEGVSTGMIGKITKYVDGRYYFNHQEIPELGWALSGKFLKRYIPTPKVALDSVVISDKKKEEIKAAISQIKNDELIFSQWGFSEVFEKGTAVSLLFWGIPGTGKTLTAQAIADEIDGELKIIGTAEIQSSEPGGAERTIKEIFAQAKQKSKEKQQIILFDECDTLLMDRNEVGPILGAMVNALLTELEHHDGVVIFTTNRMGKLDPALERRITAKVEFEFPDREQRHRIWIRLIPKKAPIGQDVDFKVLAEYPLAGGNIKNAVLNAAREAAYRKSKTITQEHFKDAIEREALALQAFVAEYEKTSHTSLAGYVSHSERGGIMVDRKSLMKNTLTKPQKKGDNT